MIVFDTDILSMFAKIDAIDLLKHLFDERAVMTPKIRDEPSEPLEYGYSFPLKAISAIKTVPLSNEALEDYGRLQENLSLGKGELEGIAYCQKCFAEKCFADRMLGITLSNNLPKLRCDCCRQWF